MSATFCGPDQSGQLREDGVVGDRDRLGEIDRPERLAFVVVDDPQPPARIDRHLLRRGEHAGGRDVLAQGCREHERLERGAGLPLALGREVELDCGGSSVLRPSRAPRPGCARCRSRRARPTVDAVRWEHRGDGIARDLLEVDVEGRPHPQAAAECLLRPELVDELILDVVGEIRRCVPLGGREPDAPGVGHRVDERVHELALGQIALRIELPEHQVAARPREPRDARPGPRGSGPPGCRRAVQPPPASSDWHGDGSRSCSPARRRTRRSRSRQCSGRRSGSCPWTTSARAARRARPRSACGRPSAGS